MKSAPVTYPPGLKLTVPPPAFAHASMAVCIAFVEFVSPSPTAPYAFASKTFFRVGFRRALTVFTHAGKPASLAFALPCADAPTARGETQKRKANAATTVSDLFNITLPGKTVKTLKLFRLRPLDARVGDGARVADAEVLDVLQDEGRHVGRLLRSDAEEGRTLHVFEVEGGAQVFHTEPDLDVRKLHPARVAYEEAVGRNL